MIGILPLCRILHSLMLAALACAPIVAAEPPLPRIAGIRVVSFTPDPVANEREPINRAWPFNSSYQMLAQGTHIDVLIPSPPGGFVGNNLRGPQEIGKITRAVDSLGKDLTTPRVHQVQGNEWPITAQVSDIQNAADGSSAMVTLFLPQTPTPGAGSIELAAEVPLTHCSKVREFTATDVRIKRNGTSFELGGLTLKVEEIRTIEHDGRKTSFLYLESDVIHESLQRLELRVKGETLAKFKWQPYTTGRPKDRTTSYSCKIDGVPDQVDVFASFYEDTPVTLTIPIATTAGLGLGAGKDGDAPHASAGAEITVAGFEIVDPATSRLMPHGYKIHGTTIAFTLLRSAGGMIKLDPAKSSIEQATDNTGKDLTTPRADTFEPDFMVQPRFGGPAFPREGTSGGIEIKLPQAPTPGSNSIHFRASLALICHDEFEEFKAGAADLTKSGAAYEAGPFRFEVIRPKASGELDQHQPCMIKMTTRRNPKEIKHVMIQAGDRTFLAERGMSSIDGGEYEASYLIHGLAELPASADVVVAVYKDMDNPKTLMVPVEGTIGLGLPPQR